AITAFERGWTSLKLYFMVGLPGERAEDVDAIVSLAKRVKHLMLKVSRNKARLGVLTLSLSPFVPKPFTSFEREPMDGLDVLRAKLRRVSAGLRRESNIRVNHEVPKWSLIQGILSRGDRRVGEVLLEAHRLGGDWRKAMALKNLNPDHYALRRRGPEERLPWAHVEV
ncbi:MAG: radical SAM protein, partial [Nitrospinota bacterium]